MSPHFLQVNYHLCFCWLASTCRCVKSGETTPSLNKLLPSWSTFGAQPKSWERNSTDDSQQLLMASNQTRWDQLYLTSSTFQAHTIQLLSVVDCTINMGRLVITPPVSLLTRLLSCSIYRIFNNKHRATARFEMWNKQLFPSHTSWSASKMDPLIL